MSEPVADAAAPGHRLERLGHRSASRNPEGGPKELTARHRLLVEYQLDGCPHRNLLERLKTRQKAVIGEATGKPEIRMVSPEPGEALTLIEAADVLRIRRRNARQLTKTPAYMAYMAAELQAFRDGEKARSLHTMVEMRDEPGLGKAADRKVRLSAAQMLMGEGEGNRSSPTVNVFNGGQRLVAGIVVVRRSDKPVQPRTIEHESGSGED